MTAEGQAEERDPSAELLGRNREALSSLASELVAAIASDELGGLDSPGAGDEDFAHARQALEHQLALLSEGRRLVREAAALVDRRDERRKHQEKYDDVHWPARKGALVSAASSSPEEGLRLLLVAYSDALANWELGECGRLADLEIDPPAAREWLGSSALRQETDSLLAGKYEDVDGFVAYMAEGAPVGDTPSIDRHTMSTMEVLRGRLKLARLADADEGDRQRLDEEIEGHFNRAADLDPESALPLAGRSALWRARGDRAGAI